MKGRDRRRGCDESIEELGGEPLWERGEIDVLADICVRHPSDRSVTAAGTPRAKAM